MGYGVGAPPQGVSAGGVSRKLCFPEAPARERKWNGVGNRRDMERGT